MSEDSLEAIHFPKYAPHSPMPAVLMTTMKRVQVSAHLEMKEPRSRRDAQPVHSWEVTEQGLVDCSASGGSSHTACILSEP